MQGDMNEMHEEQDFQEMIKHCNSMMRGNMQEMRKHMTMMQTSQMKGVM
jgi:hypothetical protein